MGLPVEKRAPMAASKQVSPKYTNLSEIFAENSAATDTPQSRHRRPGTFSTGRGVPTATLRCLLGPTPQGCAARGRWRTRAGTACTPSPTCRIPLASLATRRRRAPPTRCRRARSGGRGAAAPLSASGPGAATRRGPIRCRSALPRSLRAAVRRGRMVRSPGAAHAARRGSGPQPPGDGVASGTKQGGTAAAPRLRPWRGPADAPPAP
jgi:hypothetical protein